MLGFIVQRTWQSLLVLYMAVTAVFFLIRMIPGDPALTYAGVDASPEVVAAIRADFGLDQPLLEQYWIYLSRVVHLDFGQSYRSLLPARELVASALTSTLELVAAAALIATLYGCITGILSAQFEGHPIDHVISTGNAFSLGMPAFWFGLLLVSVFSVHWGLLPSGGQPGWDDPVLEIKALALPALTLSVHLSAVVSRFVKDALLNAMNEDFYLAARSKGVGGLTLLLRHGVRYGLIPLVTVLGLELGALLAGAVIIETVFSWPGMGRLLVQSVGNRDYTLVQAILLTVALGYILINAVTDVIYRLLDPRTTIGVEARST